MLGPELTISSFNLRTNTPSSRFFRYHHFTDGDIEPAGTELQTRPISPKQLKTFPWDLLHAGGFIPGLQGSNSVHFNQSTFPYRGTQDPCKLGPWQGPATHCLREGLGQRPTGWEQPGDPPCPPDNPHRNGWGWSLRCAFAQGPFSRADFKASSGIQTRSKDKTPCPPHCMGRLTQRGWGPGGSGPASSAHSMASGDKDHGTQGQGARTCENFISKYL